MPRLVHSPRLCRSHEQPGPQDSGLHLLRRADGGDEAAPAAAERVWKGDARSCCAWDQPDGGLGLAVGTEPADVFCSLDGGRTFSEGTDGFAAAPSRAQWKFPAPPHQPHVLSIEPLPVAAGSGGADPGAGQVQLVAGIEVGGVLVSRDAGGGGPWEERSKGLFTDVHSCRIDPHDPSRWLTVTGEVGLGLAAAGDSWRAGGRRTRAAWACSTQRQSIVVPGWRGGAWARARAARPAARGLPTGKRALAAPCVQGAACTSRATPAPAGSSRRPARGRGDTPSAWLSIKSAGCVMGRWAGGAVAARRLGQSRAGWLG